MNKIIWEESKFSVGSNILDMQHKKLLNICNKFYDLIEKEDNSENEEANIEREFDNIMHELSLYALQHFKTEEALLKKYNYPNIQAQQDDHYSYQDELISYLNAAYQKKLDKKELYSFLYSWWTEHILVKDMEFKSFLIEKWEKQS